MFSCLCIELCRFQVHSTIPVSGAFYSRGSRLVKFPSREHDGNPRTYGIPQKSEQSWQNFAYFPKHFVQITEIYYLMVICINRIFCVWPRPNPDRAHRTFVLLSWAIVSLIRMQQSISVTCPPLMTLSPIWWWGFAWCLHKLWTSPSQVFFSWWRRACWALRANVSSIP